MIVSFDSYEGFNQKHFGPRSSEEREWRAQYGRNYHSSHKDLGYLQKDGCRGVLVYVRIGAGMEYAFHSRHTSTRDAEKAVKALFASAGNLYAFYEARRDAAFKAIHELYSS